MIIPKLAYRSLLRNRRRTILTMTAMGIATAIVITILGIYDGMLWDMINGATDLYHGHVKINAENYRETGKMQLTIPQGQFENEAREYHDVKGAAGRIRGFALISYGEEDSSRTHPAELLGISPEEERSVIKLEDSVTKGGFVESESSNDIVLGSGLARLLGAEIGGEIVTMGQASDGSIAAGIFIVKGIIRTGNPIRDASLAIVGRETLQRMLVLEGQLHEVAISLKNPVDAEVWAHAFPESEGVEVTSWNIFLPGMGAMMEIWGVMKFIFALIFYFAVVLVTVNTMYMAFMERKREFGIMGAIGMKPRRQALMILVEGFIMSFMAGLAGVLVGILATLYLNRFPIDLSGVVGEIAYAETVIVPRITSNLMTQNILIPFILVMFFGVGISLFPARRLTRLRVVEVLREV